MKTHPDIPLSFAVGLRKVRALFVEKPDAYDGQRSYVASRAGIECGCICAWLKTMDYDISYHTSPAYDHMLLDSAEDGKRFDTSWAIARIDRALLTNA